MEGAPIAGETRPSVALHFKRWRRAVFLPSAFDEAVDLAVTQFQIDNPETIALRGQFRDGTANGKPSASLDSQTWRHLAPRMSKIYAYEMSENSVVVQYKAQQHAAFLPVSFEDVTLFIGDMFACTLPAIRFSFYASAIRKDLGPIPADIWNWAALLPFSEKILVEDTKRVIKAPFADVEVSSTSTKKRKTSSTGDCVNSGSPGSSDSPRFWVFLNCVGESGLSAWLWNNVPYWHVRRRIQYFCPHLKENAMEIFWKGDLLCPADPKEVVYLEPYSLLTVKKSPPPPDHRIRIYFTPHGSYPNNYNEPTCILASADSAVKEAAAQYANIKGRSLMDVRLSFGAARVDVSKTFQELGAEDGDIITTYWLPEIGTATFRYKGITLQETLAQPQSGSIRVTVVPCSYPFGPRHFTVSLKARVANLIQAYRMVEGLDSSSLQTRFLRRGERIPEMGVYEAGLCDGDELDAMPEQIG